MREKYSIFATLGTATQPFDRFIQIVDEAAERAGLTALIQTGHSHLEPEYSAAVPFLPAAEFEARVRGAAHVITHAGEGSVMAVLRCGKRPIVIARRKHLGEHVNDHQVELVEEFERMNLVTPAESAEQVLAHLNAAPRGPLDLSPFHNAPLLRLVGAFLES